MFEKINFRVKKKFKALLKLTLLRLWINFWKKIWEICRKFDKMSIMDWAIVEKILRKLEKSIKSPMQRSFSASNCLDRTAICSKPILVNSYSAFSSEVQYPLENIVEIFRKLFWFLKWFSGCFSDILMKFRKKTIRKFWKKLQEFENFWEIIKNEFSLKENVTIFDNT